MTDPRTTHLNHLTLNTGHLARTPRSDVDRSIVRLLMPLARAGFGPVPGLSGWYLRSYTLDGALGETLPGVAYFGLFPQPEVVSLPAVWCVACWRAESAAMAWRRAAYLYRAYEASLARIGLWREPDPQPPAELPWLAVWMLPSIAHIDRDITMALGDLERCLAWTMRECSA